MVGSLEMRLSHVNKPFITGQLFLCTRQVKYAILGVAMSVEDRKKKELMQVPASIDAVTPNKKFELKAKVEKQEEKERAMFMTKIERDKLLKQDKSQKKEAEGTGGLKKDQVLTAEGKASIKQLQQMEKLKAKVEKLQGQTEQPTKNV